MIRASILLVLATNLVAVPDRVIPPESSADELNRLEGTWALASGEKDGKSFSEDTVKAGRLILRRDSHEMKLDGDAYKGKQVVDPRPDPKVFDFNDAEGPFKGNVARGIYKTDGDLLRICLAPPGKDRPKEFKTGSGTGSILCVWKRVKN